MIRSTFPTALASLCVALLFAPPDETLAQLPQATPEQRAAGARVAQVRFDTDRVVVQRGDTVRLSAELLDDAGQPVEGALALLFAQGMNPTITPITGGGLELTAGGPGSREALVLVMVPEGGRSMFGIDGITQVGSLPIEVADWPVARIQIDDPDRLSFVGSVLRMSGRVLTTHDTEHASAAITWSSADPSVATVTRGGIVTGVKPGEVRVRATTESGVDAEHRLTVRENTVRGIAISPRTASARTGDVVAFEIVATDAEGRPVPDAPLDLAVAGIDANAGFVFDDGTFVAEKPGAYRVLASLGGVSAAAAVEVEDRDPPVEVELVDHGPRAEVSTSDLWVFEGRDGRDYAYTGTHARGGGERMFVWDVTDPAAMVLMDSVVVDARVVNDVKVNADATWAVITREGASTRRNGIVVLDLSDPAHPTILAELTDSLTGGIHNTWINGDVVYAVNDGTSAMNIIDLADPASPRNLGRWELRPGETDKTLHDVWAEDGYAYLSYWDDGLVILDVGAGTHGGTPRAPTFVSSISYPEGNTHVAWRDRDYVFLGDEIGTPDGMRGFVHVVDVSDIENPRQVAKYDLPEAGAHNVWVENDILYIAYYQGGLRMVDVSGTLRGDLYRQGRELGLFRTAADVGEGVVPNAPMAWGPQPHKGHVFVSDMNSGLWVIKHAQPRRVTF
jgi:hypothetical protein